MRELKEGTPRLADWGKGSWQNDICPGLEPWSQVGHRKRGASMAWIFQGEFLHSCFLKLVDFPHILDSNGETFLNIIHF